MKPKHKQIELILLLVFTAICCNLIIDLDFVSMGDGKGVHNQSLFLAIGYICISKLLAMKNKYQTAMILGQLFFMSLCAFLYYAVNISDYISLGISIYSVISTIILLQNEYKKMNKEEEK